MVVHDDMVMSEEEEVEGVEWIHNFQQKHLGGGGGAVPHFDAAVAITSADSPLPPLPLP